MSPRRRSPSRWDPLAAMAPGPRPTARVQVHSPVVPAGGVLTVTASGFGPGPLAVLLDLWPDPPLTSFELEGDMAHLRVPLPSTVPAGRHLLTFAAGPTEVDLLVDVTASTASITLDRRQVPAGDRVAFTARGFPPGEVGHVKLDGEGAPVPFAIDPDGTATASFTIPPGTRPGPHHLRFLAPNPATSTVEAIVVDEP